MPTITNNSRTARTIHTKLANGKTKLVTIAPGESHEGEPVSSPSFDAAVSGGRFTVKGATKKAEPKADDK